MLPQVGEMTHLETAPASISGSGFTANQSDFEDWVRFSQHAEATGIESVLLYFDNYDPDPLMVACALGLETRKLKFLVAYRPGLMQPTLSYSRSTPSLPRFWVGLACT